MKSMSTLAAYGGGQRVRAVTVISHEMRNYRIFNTM